jgi:pimeloyl-ACP methyl ester carboxylesterase
VTTGTGPPLVLVHGVAGSHRVFDLLMPTLEEHFQVLRLDLLGYGHSPKPHHGYGPDDHLGAIHQTIERSGLPKPFVALGLSMGVNLVLHYARRWPSELAGLIGSARATTPTSGPRGSDSNKTSGPRGRSTTASSRGA